MSMYRVLSYAMLAWATFSLAGIVGTVVEAGLGVDIPVIEFDQSRPGAPASAGTIGFVIFTITSLFLVATLLQGARTAKRLETISENWSQSTGDLRLLALMLLGMILAQFIGTSVISSIATSRELEAFSLVPVIDSTQLGIAFIALIIYFAARALDLAQAEVEENRTFF